MAKWVCPVCGYVHEGETAPEKCPLCGVPGAKFKKQEGGLNFVTEHKIGDGIVDDAEVTQGLKDHFYGECTEVGMYLAMSRQADREGYPEVAEAYKRIAFEEAEHAAKFAELLGKTIDIVTDSTKTNLQRRVDAECGATAGKMAIAARAKQLGSTRSTTPSTRWRRTKRVTARPSRVCCSATSSKRPRVCRVQGRSETFRPLFSFSALFGIICTQSNFKGV